MDRKGRLIALEEMSDYLASRSEASLHAEIKGAVATLAAREQEDQRDFQNVHSSKEPVASKSEYETLSFLRAITNDHNFPHVRAALDCLLVDFEVEAATKANSSVTSGTGSAR